MSRCALMDIGSNTARLVLYTVEKGSFTRLVDHRENLGLISYVADQLLSREGLAALAEWVATARRMVEISGCDRVDCFATAALRDVLNKGEVVDYIYRTTGLPIRILSEPQEAYYEFRGLMTARQVADGLCLDVGGGSAQLFSFSGRQMGQWVSLPIGSLHLYNRFVDGILPREGQSKRIRSYVKAQVREGRFAKKAGAQLLYVLGGTARAMAQLDMSLAGQGADVDGYRLPVERVLELIEHIKSMRVEALRLLNRVNPDRVHTIVPGMIAISEVARFVGAQQLEVVRAGVREGYLASVVIGGEKPYLPQEGA